MTAPRTLLFVDDDREFLQAQAALFGARGYTVLTADTTEAAVETLARSTPDVIVLDLMMEHYDSGLILCRRIRRDARFAQTPIVMLSGVAATTGHQLAGEEKLMNWSQLDLFLDKPVSSRRLLQVVEERLETAAHPEG
jgi:CheY-like chemotaxis protein